MRKIDGLKFLQRHFPEVCVDCVFIGHGELLDEKLLEQHHPQVFRIRSGRDAGSELNSPQKTCYSAREVMDCVSELLRHDRELRFVIHRVTAEFFRPKFVGSIALFEQGNPIMLIEFQAVSKDLVAKMDCGVRPRDWKVVGAFSYHLHSMSPDTFILDPSFSSDSVKVQLYALWGIGRKLSTLKNDRQEMVTRFNIYQGGTILLDDHRAVSSFK